MRGRKKKFGANNNYYLYVIVVLLLGLFLALPKTLKVRATENSVPPPPPVSQPKKHNPALALSVEAVLQKIKAKDDLTLVDVRPAKDFEASHIPDSINIPLFAIKTKPFLKSKPLILIGEGYAFSRMEQECARLRKTGFPAWYLYGGLSFWSQRNAPLQGNVFAQKEFNKVPARIFFEEKDYADWIIVDVSQTKKSEGGGLFSQSLRVPYSRDTKDFAARLKTSLAKYSGAPSSCVLIIDEKGEKYDFLEPLIYKANLKNVFFLQGGREAYKKFLEQQALLQKGKNNAQKVVKKCANCK